MTATAMGGTAREGSGGQTTSGSAYRALLQVLRPWTGLLAIVAACVLVGAALEVVPPLVAITRFFQVRVRAAERATRQAVGQLNAHLQEMLGGVEVIRAFGREGHFVARFRRTLRRTLAASNRSYGYSAVYPPAMN